MPFSTTDASQEELSAAVCKPPLPTSILEKRPVARPLVPVTLALMAGMAAPAWGLLGIFGILFLLLGRRKKPLIGYAR